MGATDLGTGTDTALAQIAAEVLGCPVEDIIVYASDTDLTPFDKGAYASSTIFISGGAVKKAAEDVARQIREVAAQMMEVHPDEIRLAGRRAWAPDGDSVSLREVALQSLHVADQHQIMGTASHMSMMWSPPFGAQFAELEVDTETGEVRVLKVVSAIDCGQPINPDGVEGQIDGGVHMALGYALSEEMVYDGAGRLVNGRIGDYHLFRADEMPQVERIIVPTVDPAGPFGAKSVAEIPADGVAPAVVNAIYNATGVWLRELPATPERVWRALREG